MRNFDERKAEVFRRSEERIKIRKKKRNRAISVCIPVLICISFYAVMILPAMMPASSEYVADQNIENDALLPITVEFNSKDGSLLCVYTDTESIERICTIIESVINQNITEEQSTTERHSDNSYSIVIVNNSGDINTYIITGSTLFNTVTERSYILTQEQKSELDLFREE